MRATTIAVLSAALMGTCVLSACGDDGRGMDSDTDGATPTTDGGVPTSDAELPPPPPPAEGCGGELLTIGHAATSLGRVATGRAHFGAIQRGANRLIALGEHLSPVLARLPHVELKEEGGVVHSAAVSGEVPAGQIYQTVWHDGLDRFVLLTLDRDPFRYRLHTLALDGTTAVFAALEQTAEPPGEGLIVTAMHPFGSNQLVVERGEETYTVTIDGDAATWSAPSALALGAYPAIEVADPAHARVLGFGAQDFDPATGAVTLRPVVYQRSLPNGGWSELPTGGGAPPDPITSDSGFVDGWAGYDAGADRLFVTLGREVYDEVFMETYWQTGLWAVDLGTGEWSLVVDPFNESGFAYGPAWAVDPVHHRALEFGLGGLVALHTDGPSMGTVEALPLDGAVGPQRPQAATSLADGRLVALSGGQLIAYDPSASEPRWEVFGDDLELPSDVREGASLDRDPMSGDLWLFGGASSNASPSMGRVLRIAADGSSSTEETTTGAPEGRSYHSTLIHGGELFVVGGASSLEARDDVWALDLSDRSWRSVTTLPSPRMRAAIRMVDGELWIAGGHSGDTAAGDVVAIDPASGASRTLSVSGEPPPRGGIFSGSVAFGGGLVLFDLNDDTLDSDGVTLHQLAPEGEGAHWVSLGGCFLDWHVHDLRGVSMSEERAFFVGTNLFELRAR